MENAQNEEWRGYDGESCAWLAEKLLRTRVLSSFSSMLFLPLVYTSDASGKLR